MTDQHEGACCEECLDDREVRNDGDLREHGACCCESPLMEGHLNE